MLTYNIILLIVTGLCLGSELARDLMMMQQNSYRPERYTNWLRQSGDTTSMWRLCGLIIFFIALSLFSRQLAPGALMLIFGVTQTVVLLRRKYKKPLVWTARARRIYAVALTLTLLTGGACALIFNDGGKAAAALYSAAVALLGCYCASHIFMLAAVWLLSPVEKAINRRYYNDARDRLRSMPDLKIIGITGSYGKTSTKHYLHRILSEQFDTLMTPGSFNTTLGVVRTVREYLKPYNEVFICEMGAKNTGDIKEICDLVEPRIGIITAVGPQHLESFGTLENVCRTKFELADALPADGLAVVNDDFEAAAARPVDNVSCIRYALQNTAGARYTATDISYSSHGTTFTVTDLSGELPPLALQTALVGDCNISNLLAAVAVARHLGVADDKIAYAVSQIQPVEHRLSIKRTAGGVTILDDAFNSNPVGSAMAVEVLGKMPGRGIVVTPGMIELGDRTFELNARLGDHIARHADIAIIVGQYNRDAIAEGLRRSEMPEERVHLVDSFAEAQQLLGGMLRSGDIVLYENDLPDTFK